MLAHVQAGSREAVSIPAEVNRFDNWNQNWELHASRMVINGIPFDVYLAVLRSNRGVRAGTYFNVRDNVWTADGWTGL